MTETRSVWVIVGDGGTQWEIADDAEAAAKLHAVLLNAAAVYDRRFPQSILNAHIAWSLEEVPATPLDALLDEYVPLHDSGGADSVDRDDPFLLVEENVRGGYWLTTGDSVEHLAIYHENQEYASEWDVVGIFDTATGVRVNYKTTVTVTVEDE